MTEIKVVYQGPIVKRKDALLAGLPKYFSGTPCKYGHLAERVSKTGYCTECRNIKWKSYYDERMANDPDWAVKRNKASMEKYHQNMLDPEWVMDRKEKEKKYRDQNPWLNEYKSKWRRDRKAIDPEYAQYIYEQNREIRQSNKERYRAHSQNRRAKVNNAEGYFTKKDIDAILSRQKMKCAECKTSLKNGYEVDHIMPIVLGGSNWPSNLQCLCMMCNRKKGGSHPLDWAAKNGRLL